MIYNTNRASRGNLGLSASAFCIRSSDGNLMYAEVQCLGIATNLYAEIVAIKMALSYYVEWNIIEIQVQIDTFGIIHMINGEWKIP